jgi:hypothetical protein
MRFRQSKRRASTVKIEFMDERVSGLASQPRFITLLVGMFAAFGLVLAAVDFTESCRSWLGSKPAKLACAWRWEQRLEMLRR